MRQCSQSARDHLARIKQSHMTDAPQLDHSSRSEYGAACRYDQIVLEAVDTGQRDARSALLRCIESAKPSRVGAHLLRRPRPKPACETCTVMRRGDGHEVTDQTG